jgi:hypothetical protein
VRAGETRSFSRRCEPFCHATSHPIRSKAASSCLAFTDPHLLMQRRTLWRTALEFPHRARCSRRQHVMPERAPRLSRIRALGRTPSPPAWTPRRPTNGRPLPDRRRWKLILLGWSPLVPCSNYSAARQSMRSMGRHRWCTRRLNGHSLMRRHFRGGPLKISSSFRPTRSTCLTVIRIAEDQGWQSLPCPGDQFSDGFCCHL